MTTYYDGLKVPQTIIEDTGELSFSGITDCKYTLKYVPKGGNEGITVIPANTAALQLSPGWVSYGLSGKEITIVGLDYQYDKADTPTGTTDAAGGGAIAEPHSHEISYTATSLNGSNPVKGGTNIRFLIIYAPEGGS